MPVSEAERMELVGKLTDAIGKEAAETLMACILPDGRDQLATKADLERQSVATKADFEGLRVDLEVLRAETKAEFATLRAETNAGFAEVRSFLETKLARQARLHYGSLAAFILSVWGVFVAQTFMM